MGFTYLPLEILISCSKQVIFYFSRSSQSSNRYLMSARQCVFEWATKEKEFCMRDINLTKSFVLIKFRADKVWWPSQGSDIDKQRLNGLKISSYVVWTHQLVLKHNLNVLLRWVFNISSKPTSLPNESTRLSSGMTTPPPAPHFTAAAAVRHL